MPESREVEDQELRLMVILIDPRLHLSVPEFPMLLSRRHAAGAFGTSTIPAGVIHSVGLRFTSTYRR